MIFKIVSGGSEPPTLIVLTDFIIVLSVRRFIGAEQVVTSPGSLTVTCNLTFKGVLGHILTSGEC